MKKTSGDTVKTNAMRQLEVAGISYRTASYEYDESNLSGLHAAEQVGIPAEQVFKTLVTRGDKTGILVFCIPVDMELDLKKAAKAVGEKSVEMLHVKEITKVTGYVRGGCTAIGMKKQFPTVIDESACTQKLIYVSGGKIGMQIRLKPDDLKKAANAEYAAITF